MSFYTTHFAYATEDWGSAVGQQPIKEDPTTIEVLPEELRPVVDISKLRRSSSPARSARRRVAGSTA
jgi:DNA-binding transcriptional regulator YdaS (Cro superfamily)